MNRQKKGQVMSRHYQTSSYRDMRKDRHGDSHTKGEDKQWPDLRCSLGMPVHIWNIYIVSFHSIHTHTHIHTYFISLNCHPSYPFKLRR